MNTKSTWGLFCRWARLLLMFACALAAMPSYAASQVIQNDVFWKDTAGNNIYSQGGGILKVGSTYYWYGVKYNGAETYAANPASKNSDTSFNAVTVYSSTDLAHWKFEANAISVAPAGQVFESATWLGRLGVVYNSTTHKYVLITQYSSTAMGAGVLFATSSSPTGPFVYDHMQAQITNVVTPSTGDQTVFIDDDGKAYLVFSNSNGRSHLYVAPIRTSDSLNIEAATNIYNSGSGGREGNAMFKYNGTYYFCSSDLHGWNASHTYCITANNITGPYSAEFVVAGTDADFSHVTQTGFFIPVHGSAGTTILFAGDRWSDFAGNGIGYNQWTPLSFSGSTPKFNSLSQFNLDAATGSWSVGSGNNYILNPSFEADRVGQNVLAGWSNWSNLSGVDPNSNVAGGHSGRWAMTQSYTAAYSASMYQNVTLPNGTYTLKAWVRSSGGQSIARIYVKNFGSAEIDYSINTSIANWTQISIPNIVVSNGTAQVGVYSVANANNWVRVDDFTLIKN
ncbi:family 43 glycosylhydrolase [Undibacterium sp. CY18W]|uniref:Family 43 glycosylhydrolase n=1 Tax=Undibacterium hunanense TaxID=2762292 RepID=A0ABR6ZWY4_9BURK|nr:family 43 glycosylhydrolase [Undibacterium hunanense]MBC3920388.1 family 43 glycosylhydrolase [Undibacterium hunanense]